MSKWIIESGDQNNWYVQDGVLHLYKESYTGGTMLTMLTQEGNDWGNYKTEAKIKGIKGVDQAIVLRAQNEDNNYRITFRYLAEDIAIEAVVDGQGDHFIPYHYNYPFVHDKWYNIKIEIEDFNIRVNVKPAEEIEWPSQNIIDIEDENHYFQNGKVGLSGWVGGGGTYKIHVLYDNVKVEFLEPGLGVVHFMQTDEEWATDTYDKAEDWDLTGNSTIGNYGCALTSAAMVLNFHGIDKLNETTSLTPGTLNDWLNENTAENDWWRQGHVNWGAISSLTEQLNDLDPEIPKLEFVKLTGVGLSEVRSALNDEVPDILEVEEPASPSNVHFMVSNGIDEDNDDILVNDPFDENNTAINETNTALYSVNRFYEAESDFSYIFLHADEGLDVLLTNPNSQVVTSGLSQSSSSPDGSWYILRKPLYPKQSDTPSGNDPFHELAIPKPMTGNYQLVLSADQSGFYEFEFHLYDEEGSPYPFRERHFVAQGMPLVFNLFYFKDFQEDEPRLVKQSTFEYLRAAIEYADGQGWIKRTWMKNQLLRYLVRVEKVYGKNPAYGKRMLRIFLRLLGFYNKTRLITNQGYQFLKEETKLLLEVL